MFVENTNQAPVRDLPFVLMPSDIQAVERAIVEVRAWHADRFYPSVIESSPVLYQFVSEDSLALASEVFAGRPFGKVLVVSELPVTLEQRQRSIGLLEETGIDHVIEFPTVLQDLLGKVSVNRSYAASHTLETLRLLKRYKLIRNLQMEFAFYTEAPPPLPGAEFETAHVPDEDEQEE